MSELEKMISPQELATLWGVHPKTIQRLFIDEPGVFKMGNEGIQKRKRQQVTLRIPLSVVQRVYKKRTK